MNTDEQIIEQLDIAAFPEQEKRALIEQAQLRIGESIRESLSDQKINEYQAIIDGNEQVINAWLDETIPDYKNAAVYQSLEEGSDSDPDHNDPAKIFASLAWVQINIPNIQEIVAKTLADFKQELATRP